MKYIIPIFFTMIVLSSCNKTVPCDKNQIIPVFIGFSSNDFDTVILKKYKKGNNFTLPIDSAIFLKNGVDSNRFYTFSDTTIINFNTVCCTKANLIPEYDWQLILPNKKYTISISDIESPQTDISCFMGKCSCVNPINSIVENGEKVIPVYYQYTRYYKVSGYVSYVNSGYALFIK